MVRKSNIASLFILNLKVNYHQLINRESNCTLELFSSHNNEKLKYCILGWLKSVTWEILSSKKYLGSIEHTYSYSYIHILNIDILGSTEV